jgi:hypothetical protein
MEKQTLIYEVVCPSCFQKALGEVENVKVAPAL